jgi:hypothetical protein
MPREDRKIIFANEEVYKALYALAVQKQVPKPPAGAVTQITLTNDDPPKIILLLENPAVNSKETAEFSYDFTAAALMVYCRGLGIPLPKKASKSVQILDGELVLRVQV